MRTGLSTVAAKGNITAQWVFEVDGNYWTFGNAITYGGNTYTSRIITKSFTGIKEKNTRYADRMIPPNTTEFAITGAKTDFSAPGFKGDDVLITLLDSGTKVYAWRFHVKSCDYAYGKFTFKCEDFLQKYLFNNYYPNTALLNSYNTTSSVFTGPENAVIPEVFGTAFPQLRQIPDSGEWYTVLGAVSGTYTVTKIQSPVDWKRNFSEYETPTYTFTTSTLSGLAVFENDIGYEGGNLPFGNSGKLNDMPTQYSNSLTASVTSLADIIAYILQVLGVPVAQIDIAGTFAATKATLATIGITCNYCFHTKEDALKVLCELLESCNCIMPRSDVVQLIALEDGAAVKTIDRDNILNLKFSEKVYSESFDGGYAQYYLGVQAGDPAEIEIPIDGASASNVSGDKVLYKYTTDTQIIQQLAIIYFRRKYLQTGTVTFSSNHSMLEPYLGDRLSISDDLYEDYANVYVDQITIKPDLKFEFSLDAFSETIGDLTDYTPTAVSKIVDVSIMKTDDLLKSDNYDAQISTESWYKIDPEDGTAHFNNITMTFTGNAGAGRVFTNVCNDPPDGADNDLWIPSNTCVSVPTYQPSLASVASGRYHVVGVVEVDGSVEATTYNTHGETNVSTWTDIIDIACGEYHTVGLMEDKTVVYTGLNTSGQISLSTWSALDLVSIACGQNHTVGLLSDGTVVAAGDSGNNRLAVTSWTGIVDISAGSNYTAGLKADGSVVTTSEMDVSSWSGLNIISISCGHAHMIGITSDGDIATAGSDTSGKLNTSAWTDIVSIACGYYHSVGLKADGTVLVAGSVGFSQTDVDAWATLGVVEVICQFYTVYGLLSDGTVVAAGSNTNGRTDVSGWTGISTSAMTTTPYYGGEIYLYEAGVWSTATNYEEITATTISDAMVSTPAVFTNVISNDPDDPDLTIDFDTSTITVNTADGLVVNSTGGVSVIAGGDMNFFTDGTNDSYIKFYNDETIALSDQTISIHGVPDSFGVTGDLSLVTSPDDDTCNYYLGEGAVNRFQIIAGYSTDRITWAVSDETGLSAGDPFTYYSAIGLENGDITINSEDSSGDGTIYLNAASVLRLEAPLIKQALATSAPADGDVPNDHAIFYYVSGNLWAKWKEGSTNYNKQIT